MRARSGTNSMTAVSLAARGLLIAVAAVAVAVGPRPRDDPRCSPSLSVILENATENGDDVVLYRDGDAYTADLRWTDGNLTYGCVCKLRKCVRKCCRDDEVLCEDLSKPPVCEKISRGDNETSFVTRTPELRLTRAHLANEIQHVGELKEHFRLVEELNCPAGTYGLDPDEYEKDRFVMQENGSLVNARGEIHLPWEYCLDWQVTYDRIGVLVCMATQTQPDPEKNMAHHVGFGISIPFLFATFLVYAITPELRNLYGKTLMCYVICLVVAYLFLILASYVYMYDFFCALTGERPLEFSSSLGSLFSFESKLR